MLDQTPNQTTLVEKRDYSLTGPSAQRAMELGLVSAEWYHSEVPRKVMKDLMQRKDGPAIRDTVIWLGLLALTALGGIYFWGTWTCVPFWLVYGVLYGSACDSRWHECGHGTAFKTSWMNDVVYEIASFMVIRNPVTWRWSHARHHTDTIIVGRDAEIAWMHPTSPVLNVLHFVGVVDAWASLKVLARNATGNMSPDERNYIPASELPRAVFAARIHMAIYAATLIVALWMQSFLPFMVIGLPRIYGCWHMILTGQVQHGGLAEDVIDHRLNSRTCLMNPLSRWIYWNMNYHVEHHMFPMVPYHALPRLHALIKDDLPAPCPSIYAAFAEMIPAIRRQRHEKGYYLRKELPPSARPYREEFHQEVPDRAGMES
ncbi:MAG: fatty acid desaturase family protein [bacterium]